MLFVSIIAKMLCFPSLGLQSLAIKCLIACQLLVYKMLDFCSNVSVLDI